MGDTDLKGITEVVVRFICNKCGKPGEEKLTDLYCHFPVKRSLDNPTATFALPPRGYIHLFCSEVA